MTGPYVCIARLDEPDVIAKAIGPFPDVDAAQAHLDGVLAVGLIDPTMFATRVATDPAITDDTNVRPAPTDKGA